MTVLQYKSDSFTTRATGQAAAPPGEDTMLIYLTMIESDQDKSKFEIIYNTYKKRMLYHAGLILGDQNDTEDVVHEAFLKLIKILDKIEDPVCPRTKSLVVTIVERTAIDLYRRRQRKQTDAIDEVCADIPSAGGMDGLPDKADLASAMAALPARYREVLLLRYDSGFSEAETAQLLSMSQANVHKTVQRAKKKLEEILEGQEG